MLSCPKDHSALATVEVLGRQLASCPRCHGLWVEVAELEAVLRASGGPAPGTFEPQGQEEGGACPRCGRVLRAGQFPGNSLLAEHCPECQAVWLAPGRLTRLLARREPPARAPRSAFRLPTIPWTVLLLLVLFFGLGWGLMEVLWPRLQAYLQERRELRRASQAWQVRRGPELTQALAGRDWEPAMRARERYLAGDFPAAVGDLERGDELREDAELALLFDVPWPRRVVRWLRGDHLIRVVEPGLGAVPRELSLEVVAFSGQLFEPEWRAPEGSPREAPAPWLAVSRLEEAEFTAPDVNDVLVLGQTREGPLLVALISWEGRLVGYCFEGAARVRLPKPGQLQVGDERWRWRSGRFAQGEP